MGKHARVVVVSDVDGCIVDRGTRAHADADEAIDRLRQAGVPLVLCSSRTRAEVERLRQELAVADPFIAENGGAIFVPAGTFQLPPAGTVRRGAYDVMELGRPHREVLQRLLAVAARVRVDVTTFSDMSVQRVAAECGLSLGDARLAKLREYDEPFRLVEADGEARTRLRRSLRSAGVRCTSGWAFDHATLATDKGVATALLRRFYARAWGDVTLVGMGDGEGDVELLRAVDVPIVVRSPDAAATALVVEQVRRARVTAAEGPAGWSEAVGVLLDGAEPLRPAPGGLFAFRGPRGRARDAGTAR